MARHCRFDDQWRTPARHCIGQEGYFVMGRSKYVAGFKAITILVVDDARRRSSQPLSL
jgi:hypothetical protein